MPALLITSFGPWGAHRENASTLWWERAAADPPPGWQLHRAVLPVDWEAAPWELFRAMEAIEDLRTVLLCGLAENRTALTPERGARNRASTTAPDVRGATFPQESIEPSGPDAYASSLPVAELVARLRESGLPAEESRDAGTYLCNFLSYRLLEALADRPGIRGGFLHVPPRERLTDAQWQTAAEIVLATLST